MSLPARLYGVLRAPRRLFQALAARPTWLSVLVLTLCVSAACGIGFMLTDVGRQALVDEWERTAIAFGQQVDDQRYAEYEVRSAYAPAYAALNAVAAGPVLTLAVAAAIFGVFTVMRRQPARFVQVLAIAAHAGVILALRRLVVTPLGYVRETTASPATLGMFFPMLDEASPAARFFGAVDLFVLWWVVVLALGVAVLYRRPARPTVLAFVGTYLFGALVLAAAMAAAGGAP